MTQSAFKTLLLIVGSALGGIVVFIAGILGLAYYSDLPLDDLVFGARRLARHVSQPPGLATTDQFLGVTAQWTNDFKSDRDTVLGPGQFAGTITASGKPAKGLRLRLMLNGRVMSQWGESDGAGKYVITVPYGRFRIDGYELAKSSANEALPGKMESPLNTFSSPEIVISADHNGHALDLDFVDPVRKGGALGPISRTKPIVVAWEPYPGARSYRVKVASWTSDPSADPSDWFGPHEIFTVSGTSFSPAEHGLALKTGFNYGLLVYALDDKNRIIGRTPLPTNAVPDFRVAD